MGYLDLKCILLGPKKYCWKYVGSISDDAGVYQLSLGRLGLKYSEASPWNDLRFPPVEMKMHKCHNSCITGQATLFHTYHCRFSLCWLFPQLSQSFALIQALYTVCLSLAQKSPPAFFFGCPRPHINLGNIWVDSLLLIILMDLTLMKNERPPFITRINYHALWNFSEFNNSQLCFVSKRCSFFDVCLTIGST